MFKLWHNHTHLTCQKNYDQNLSIYLQKYVNWEIPDLQAEFRKDRGARDEIANNCQSLRKQGNSRKKKKKTYFCFIDYVKVFVCVDHSKLWKILKLEIPDYLTCLLSNLYETASCSQEAAVRTRHGTIDWFKIGKNIMTRLFIMTLLI